VILWLRAQGLCAHELSVLADHDFGMDLVIDGRIGSWPPGDRHCAAAVPETPAKPGARGPRERRSEVIRAGQHQSGVGAIRRRLCCDAQAVSGVVTFRRRASVPAATGALQKPAAVVGCMACQTRPSHLPFWRRRKLVWRSTVSCQRNAREKGKKRRSCWRRRFGARHVDAGSVARGFRDFQMPKVMNGWGMQRSAPLFK